MRVDEFNFTLPDELIVLRPLPQRDDARLLVVRPQDGAKAIFEDRHVGELAEILSRNDLLVFNDTKVIPAFLRGVRKRASAQAHIDITLHRRVNEMRWRAFARPAKRCAVGDIVEFAPGFFATVTARGDEGEVELGFNVTGPALDAAIAQNGSMPLPPYIVRKRPADRQDASDYQTIFAAREGAVAAPTAGLHFTPDLMHRLRAAGIGDTQITLHVGAGTFLPVKVSDTDEHRMHAEWGEITPSTAAAINRARVDGRIVAVGTTCLRLLESACNESRQVEAFAGETQIFIIPGKPIRSTDALITNFHLPRSTLFMLVCAFCGTAIMKAAYAHAINKGYRFYSYGDACLLFPGKDRLKESHERAPAV